MTEPRTPQWSLGDHLRKARTEAKISVEGMASELGVTRNTVTNYENGTTRPKRGTVRAWAEITDTDSRWLLAPFELDSVRSGWLRGFADQYLCGDNGGVVDLGFGEVQGTLFDRESVPA